MKYPRLLKYGGALILVIGAYFFGYSNGSNKEELDHARFQISNLERTIQEYEIRQNTLSNSLADIRVSESNARSESNRLREQLSEIERASKTSLDQERNRCLKLAIRGKELLDRANAAIKFCEENHR